MKNLKLRKILAYYFDFLLIFYSIVFLGKLLEIFIIHSSTFFKEFLSIVMFILVYYLFSRRDYIMKGRSLGKRIFKLAIYNESDGGRTDIKTLIKRSRIEVLFFAYDFILILVSGKELADYIYKTEARNYQK